MYVYRVEDLKAKHLAEGVEIRSIPGERMTVVFFRLDAGTRIPVHDHPHEQIGMVLRGSLELEIDGRSHTVLPGHAYRIPPGIPHGGRCPEGPVEVVEVFAPARKEYET